jgi:hypothetical protein
LTEVVPLIAVSALSIASRLALRYWKSRNDAISVARSVLQTRIRQVVRILIWGRSEAGLNHF